MSGLETLNLFFRFATVGLQIFLILRLSMDLTLRPFKGVFIGLIACSMAYVVVSSGTLFQQHPNLILMLVPFTFPITWLFWMSALSLFEDEFSIKPVHWAVLTAILGLSVTEFFFSLRTMGPAGGLMPPLNDIVNLSLVLHALYVAWRGRDADLMEERRSFRLLFVGGVGTLIGIIVATEMSFALLQIVEPSFELLLLAAVSIFAVVLYLAYQLFSLPTDNLLSALAIPTPHAETAGIDPADQALYQNLKRAMSEDKIFRTEGLTIGALAESLGAPEHQLRKLINQGMGYKNFNAYLNQYRIAAAKDKLADLEQARKQVLTIALEAGYASLGPFNRAFKDATGQTPTEFRKHALAQAAKQSQEPL